MNDEFQLPPLNLLISKLLFDLLFTAALFYTLALCGNPLGNPNPATAKSNAR